MKRHEATGDEHARRGKAQERRGDKNPAGRNEGLRNRFIRRMRSIFGQTDKDQDRDPQRKQRDHPEHPAPAEHRQHRLHRRAGSQGTERASGHQVANHRALPLGWVPHRKSLQAGHQAGRHAKTNQSARQSEFRQGVAQCKGSRTQRSEQHQHAFDHPRTETVERNPKRNLHQTEGQEVGAGEQPQVGGRKGQLTGEIGRDHGIDRAQQVRKVITQRKRQKQGDPGIGTRT